MTADRVVVLVVLVVGIAVLAAFSRKKLARMNPEERAQFDRNIAPFARTFTMFAWLWVVACLVAAAAAAVHEVWPVSIALLVVAVGVGWGMAYRNRWWVGR